MTKREYNVPELLKWVNALLAALKGGTLNGLTQVLVAGALYQITDLVTKLTAIQTMLQAVTNAELALATAVEALNEQGPAAELFLQQTRAVVKGAIGRKSPALEPFGLTPDKTPAPLTTDEMTAKVALAEATRTARHTMGPKQKAKIKGQVPAAAPAATPAATPAAAPASPPVAAPKVGS
jgi:hypothetical protein